MNGLDTLQAVSTVAAQFLHALLLEMYWRLNALRWRLAAGFLPRGAVAKSAWSYCSAPRRTHSEGCRCPTMFAKAYVFGPFTTRTPVTGGRGGVTSYPLTKGGLWPADVKTFRWYLRTYRWTDRRTDGQKLYSMVAITIADARKKLNVDRKRPIQYRYIICIACQWPKKLIRLLK